MRTSQRAQLQPAYVLHQRAFRDTSAVVELFTPEHGRVVVLAKGLKRPKSRWQGIVQPFQPLLASWSGRGEMGTLTAAEAQGRALTLQGDVLACGFYVNELVMRLLHKHDPHLELFSDYDATLRQLACLNNEIKKGLGKIDSAWSVQACLRHFEVNLMDALGYALMLDRESGSRQPIDADAFYDYTLEQGPVAVGRVESVDVSAVRVQGKTLLGLARRSLSEGGNACLFREARQLMRVVLDHYLGHQPLNSRQLFAGQRKMIPPVELIS